MSKLDLILEILNDGKWHDIKELQSKLNLETPSLEKIIVFLVSYNLAKVNSKNQLKCSREMQKLLNTV